MQMAHIPVPGPMQDVGGLPGKPPGSGTVPLWGPGLFTAHWGTLSKWGSNGPLHCHPNLRLETSDMPCPHIFYDCYFAGSVVLKSLVSQIMVCSPPWGFNPNSWGIKSNSFIIQQSQLYKSLLTPSAHSQNIMECLIFWLFQIFSLAFKQF